MNINTLKYFCDAARFESITKAAQANYISQTAMSQQIAKLEHELGVELFTREKGHIRLNSAGKSFYADGTAILELYSAAVKKAKEATNGRISVGIVTSTTAAYFEEIIRNFSKKYPSATIIPVQHSFLSMRVALESGAIDAMICPSYNVDDLPDVRSELLISEELGLLVPKSDPLAAKDEVYVSEIRQQRIIMTDPTYAGPSYSHMLNAKAGLGYVPNIVEEVSSAEMLLLLVALGRGSAFLPEDRAVYDHDRCKMLHIIDGTEINHTVIAWKEYVENPLLLDFIRTVVSFFRKDYPEWISAYKENTKHNIR